MHMHTHTHVITYIIQKEMRPDEEFLEKPKYKTSLSWHQPVLNRKSRHRVLLAIANGLGKTSDCERSRVVKCSIKIESLLYIQAQSLNEYEDMHSLVTRMKSVIRDVLFIQNDLFKPGILHHVYSYLTDKDFWTLVFINHFAYENLPALVKSLTLSCVCANAALRSRIITRCKNLRRMTIYPVNVVERFPSHPEIHYNLVSLLSRSVFPNLQSLNVADLFSGSNFITTALVNISRLRELNIAGNSLGDGGVANVLNNLECIEILDLSRNRIADLTVLNSVVSTGRLRHLRSLDLSGNYLHDESVSVLLQSLVSRNVPVLEFLGLSWNFITFGMISLLGRTLGRTQCCPRLHWSNVTLFNFQATNDVVQDLFKRAFLSGQE